MSRSLFAVPLLVAVGVLAYAASQDALDGEQVVGVIAFLVVAAPVGFIANRLSQRQAGQ